MESTLPVLQRVGEVEFVSAGDVITDQFTQVTLSSHEADQRNGFFVLRLDKL